MRITTLNGQWQLHDEPITALDDAAQRVAEQKGGWIDQPVPGDIHQGLVNAERIKEPLIGLNSYDCAWTEENSWWFKRTFQTDPLWQQSDAVELELNGLDANASIFLNGILIGKHASAFYPYKADIKQHLVSSGVNVLLVRLTSGVENVTPEQLAVLGVPVGTEAGNGRPERGDQRRVYVRKPQYSFGWDWSPRVATTAIAGDVEIRAWSNACIRDVTPNIVQARNGVDLVITSTVDCWHFFSTGAGVFKVDVCDEDGNTCTDTQQVLLRSGLNYLSTTINIPNPRLWWPNGLGEQHRYSISAELTSTSHSKPDEAPVVEHYGPFKYGLRTVQLDLGDVAKGENRFAFVVNGQRIFAKGADWIPVDAIYARVTPDKYDQLVHEAANANFNMLRVWGGGLYEPEAFYKACDQYGILLWHDFMFACAPYPDHDAAFIEEVRKEANYQTTRLRNHACMALWSGSNENNWGFDEWWHEQTRSGAHLYNYLLPAVVADKCPDTPYWNGSPYGGKHPNSAEVGDRHHWFDCMMNPMMEKRISPEEYDKCQSLFISEYGYIGAPPRESVVQYLDGAPLDRRCQAWQHHTNTFEKETIEAGITKHYADADRIDWNQYFLYSGLTQGLMYAYSLESFRAHANCHGGLFWMYADCWGEVGWTVIDYYLRRKISWYFVKRALSPVRLVMREVDGQVNVTLINDTLEPITDTLQYGVVSIDGKVARLRQKSIKVAASSRKVVASFKRGANDPTTHLWIAQTLDGSAEWAAILRVVNQRQLVAPEPTLRFSIKKLRGSAWQVRIRTDCYAHAVHLRLPVGAVPEDDYFDMLPGETKIVKVAYSDTLAVEAITVNSVICPL